MAYDKYYQTADEDLVQSNIHRTNAKLSDMGINVIDRRFYRSKHQFPDYITPNNYSNVDVFNERNEYEVKWTVELSQGIASDFINAVDHVRACDDKLCRLEQKYADVVVKLNKHVTNKNKLADVLSSHPELKDQWDQLHVLLKLSGYDPEFT